MEIEAGQAYSMRAVEYANLFGSMAGVHPSDRQLVDTWADALTGPVIDAGCGPGQWTNYLVRRGTVASGVDLSLDFIAHARAQYPGVSFEVGDIDALGIRTGALGGLLSWYSIIHHEPRSIHIPLTEFARVLRPGGGLLLGFFEGSAIEKFDHAVLDAYKWPVTELSGELCAAGFDVIETHTRTGASERPRPHGAIVARRR
jgi:SAM-dependent methyltransferase